MLLSDPQRADYYTGNPPVKVGSPHSHPHGGFHSQLPSPQSLTNPSSQQAQQQGIPVGGMGGVGMGGLGAMAAGMAGGGMGSAGVGMGQGMPPPPPPQQQQQQQVQVPFNASGSFPDEFDPSVVGPELKKEVRVTFVSCAWAFLLKHGVDAQPPLPSTITLLD